MRKPLLIQTVLSVAACKITRRLLRMSGRGGTALPGKAAMLFAHNILEVTSRGMDIIVVTGTNGKTTTSRMLEHALKSAGTECLANKSGANLLSGVTAEVTCNADWLGRPRTRAAVIECDEGALKQVVPLIHPKVIIVTNLFRDQLDRYGEVMHTLEAIRTGIRKVPESILCLNADCSLTASLAQDIPNKVVWYGLNTPVGNQEDAELSDAKYCIRCGSAYQYHYHTYAHLGSFYCPKCGYSRQAPSTAVEEIRKITSRGSSVVMSSGKERMEITVGLPAVYNLYNAAAAVCGASAFGIPAGAAAKSLEDVRSGFGRMENFTVNGVNVQMILVKNPAGCNQALNYLAGLDEDFRIVFGLNDRTADGHDISWIWDADYEQTIESPHRKDIYVFGDRAQDMRLRLKYGGAKAEDITLLRDTDMLIRELAKSPLPVFILPNYTAMLTVRALLSEVTGSQAFWE